MQKIMKIWQDLDKIQERINYVFSNKFLLIQVFLHSSLFKNPMELTIGDSKVLLENNERLEFLGDGILNYIASEYVFNKYPTFTEDSLSSYKTLIVNYFTLYKVFEYLDLVQYLVFNYESLGANSANIKNYSDVIEALIGSIYVDSKSIYPVKKFFNEIILKVFNIYMSEIIENIFDWKGFLQSLLQKKGLQLPKYFVIEKNNEGFFTIAYYNDVEVSSGFGKTKKESEKQAALDFLKKMFF